MDPSALLAGEESCREDMRSFWPFSFHRGLMVLGREGVAAVKATHTGTERELSTSEEKFYSPVKQGHKCWWTPCSTSEFQLTAGMKCSRHQQKMGKKNPHQSWQNCSKMVKIKDMAQILSRVSISSTSSHYWSAPRGWRLPSPVQAGNSASFTSKTRIPAGNTETHQVWWSLHTPLSPCQRIFHLGKEKLPSGITGKKPGKISVFSSCIN